MKKKILYLYSDTGGGHRSAATALMRAVEHLRVGSYLQEMVDVFAACSGFLNIFAKLYAPVIKYSPKMWGRLYYWLDDERKLERLEKISRPFILKELTALIQDKNPQVIVSVHPMVNHLAVQAIKETGKRIPFVMVIMDPVTLHRAWIAPEVDLCIVATPEAKRLASSYGMPEKKIKVIGLPIDPKFFLRSKKGIKTKDFTILLMGGGEGAGKMEEIVKEINRAKLKVQLIVIAGRNKKLEIYLKRKIHKLGFPMRVYGFTDQVPEIMAESDLIITKAGPGTIAEALAMNLPLIITSWLPGQEEGNVEFVEREKVGKVCKNPKKIVEIIEEFMQPKTLEEMHRNISRVSRPHAALDIAHEIFRYL